MTMQERRLDEMHLTDDLRSDRADRYSNSGQNRPWVIFQITQTPDTTGDGLHRGKRQKLTRQNNLVDHADTTEYAIGCPQGGSLPVGQPVLARLDNCTDDGMPIYNVWSVPASASAALLKITGQASGNLYICREQTITGIWQSIYTQDKTGEDSYVYFLNISGQTPTPSGDVLVTGVASGKTYNNKPVWLASIGIPLIMPFKIYP